MKSNKVHIGFGFHVNCYHSYRGDTPDALGFGGDIRIIRRIIDTLDRWNKSGTNVKGTWDFENSYSLEKILPQYAPDIIESVKRRCLAGKDENIIMGYSNGAMGAMTDDELSASLRWAVSNPDGSGIKDIFGTCAPVVRPQEVMFTPSQTAVYNKCGIRALCLYYSCVPFDAFRTVIPQLDDEFAFNPLEYVYRESSITVMPTYSQMDIMDAGSLRALATDLHRKQTQGIIGRDVFIFINMDADSMFWEPMKVPKIIAGMPNTGGLDGLIAETYDLDFVEYDTAGAYIAAHEPVKKISFGEDVADGNFTGYSSWGEKPFNRLIWTRIERARLMGAGEDEEKSRLAFAQRVRLLSTTHFGLASPVLNKTREEKALELSSQMLVNTLGAHRAPQSLTLKAPAPSRVHSAELTLREGFCRDIRALGVRADGLMKYTACAVSHYAGGSIENIYLVCLTEKETSGFSPEFFTLSEIKPGAARKTAPVSAGGLTVSCADDGEIKLLCGGEVLAQAESFITYAGRKYRFGRPAAAELPLAGEGRGISLSGEIHIKGEAEPGFYRFDFFSTPCADVVFLSSDVKYPYTAENDLIASQASNLGRRCDYGWQEAAPLSFRLRLAPDAVIFKRSFAGNLSSYPLSDFTRAFAQNSSICSFNHQLTGGIICASDSSRGLAIANARAVLGSMAHCPMRLATQKDGAHELVINPFGTFFGRQRHYPSRGNGCMDEIYSIAAPQARSLAPSYNGAEERSVSALKAVSRDDFGAVSSGLAALADGCAAYGSGDVSPCCADNVILHPSAVSSVDASQLSPVSTAGFGKIRLIGIGIKFAANYLKSRRRMRRQEKEIKKEK
jgi:hypothetical protein